MQTGSQGASRLRALDVFRGLCIAAMILVNNPGPVEHPSQPLSHAEWIGWTFADTIFPSFLWIVGVAITLSAARRLERGDTRGRLAAHAARRSALLLACGLFLDGFPRFDLATWKVTGTLQKISVAYLIAFIIFLWTTWRGQVLGLLGILAASLALMLWYPVPGCGPGSWTMDCNFARYLDGAVLAGHSGWTPSHSDPDGILSALSSTASVLFGILAGRLLLGLTERARTPVLLISGVALVSAGELLSRAIPVSKILWSPSYVFLMAGLASIAFGVCYWAVEVVQAARWFRPFEVLGQNAIAAYVVSRLGALPLKMHVLGTSIFDLLLNVARPINASLLFSFVNLMMVFVVIWCMSYRRIIIKF